MEKGATSHLHIHCEGVLIITDSSDFMKRGGWIHDIRIRIMSFTRLYLDFEALAILLKLISPFYSLDASTAVF